MGKQGRLWRDYSAISRSLTTAIAVRIHKYLEREDVSDRYSLYLWLFLMAEHVNVSSDRVCLVWSMFGLDSESIFCGSYFFLGFSENWLD